MLNFSFCNPTKIVFGKGSIEKLGDLTKDYNRIMITYGGGSIKRNGVYDKVMAQIKDRCVGEFCGIEPNPDHETCMKAVAVVKEKNPDFLLAVGGGSVLDATKYIAAAANWKRTENPFDILTLYGLEMNPEYKPHNLCPFASVMTLPATGSEMNNGSVISWRAKHLKAGFYNEYPVFSILDPEVTYSLPKKQIANGLADSFLHVCEQYLGHYGKGVIQDEQCEAIMRAIVDCAPRALECEHPDYQARAEYFWSTTMAINGLIGCGVKLCGAIHAVGHELTNFYGLDHGVTLAIVMPSLLRHIKELRRKKLERFAERVFGVHGAVDMAEEAIRHCEKFFQSLEIATTLSGNGCDDSHFQEIADKFKDMKIGEEKAICAEDVLVILKNAL